MDNLPKDPPDDNGNNNSSAPPPFGTHFNPHSNPVDPNNPYATPPQPPPPPTPSTTPIPPQNPQSDPNHLNPSIHSEIAQHRPRDAQGHFLPYEHPGKPNNPDSNSQTPSNISSSSSLPSPITITENTKYSEKKDPPLINANISLTNPVTYFKNWVGRFLKNQDIDLRLRIKPFATIGLVLAFGLVGGTTFSIGRYFFPYSSPIFHRQVVYPGIVQKGEQGQYFLMSSDSNLWKLKLKNNNVNLTTLVDKQVVITGNLTSEKYLIEVSEVIVADTQTPSQPLVSTPASPNPQPIPDQDLLPKLYSGLTWETPKNKTLTFTSGNRKMEQEVIYIESSQSNTYPQDFISYCACITAETHTKKYKNGNQQTFIHYRCTKKLGLCSQKYLNEKHLEEQIKETIEKCGIHKSWQAPIE